LNIKNLTFYVLILFVLESSIAQNIVVSAGSSDANQNFQVDYSVGQIFFQEFQDSDYTGPRSYYKEGVHQVFFVDEGFSSLVFDVVTKAYPNPTRGVFNISLDIDASDIMGLSYSIYSQQGQLIYSGIVEKNPFKIDISGFSTGVYFIYLYNLAKQTKLIKIIKY
tara:strand:- start:478 stop:972 length:495 start_codon:yes stop_codon:yes gene_type:complete